MKRTNPEFQTRSGVALVSEFFHLNFASDFFNLRLVKFLQAEIIAMKHLIQGCNNEAWVGVKPGPLRAKPGPGTKIKTGPPVKMTKTMVCQK